MICNAIYRNNPLNSAKEAFGKGFGAGAATAGINYISEHIGRKPSQGRMVNGIPSAIPAIIGDIISPYGLMRDPKRGCGGTSPFTPSIGHSSARGYQYDIPRTRESRNQNGFSLKDFLKETLLGGITGGLTSAAFYGVGKGIEKLKESAQQRRNARVRYRVGQHVAETEKTLEMALDPETYAYAIADKYGINLRGSGHNITIKYDPEIHRGAYGRTYKESPSVIRFGQDALVS